MENFGSGIRRIYSLYSDFNKNPEIAATENSFKITLYNRNYLLNQDNINEEMFVMINFYRQFKAHQEKISRTCKILKR